MVKSAKKKSNYTDNDELGGLIHSWQQKRNKMAPTKQKRLIEILYQIIGGVWDRFEFTDNRDDFCQNVIMRIFERALPKIDTAKNCFSYLTTCAVNYGQTARQCQVRDHRAEIAAGVDKLIERYGRAEDDQYITA